jgi:hypothetical protein
MKVLRVEEASRLYDDYDDRCMEESIRKERTEGYIVVLC